MIARDAHPTKFNLDYTKILSLYYFTGEVILHDQFWKGPIEVLRRKTDQRALKIYLSFFIIWLAIGIICEYTYYIIQSV